MADGEEAVARSRLDNGASSPGDNHLEVYQLLLIELELDTRVAGKL